MASYYLNEAVFDLVETFVDNTIHGLESKLPGDKTLGVLVHRREVEGDRSLRELVDENIALNEKRLSAFKVLDEARALVGGIAAVLLRASWRRDGKELYQRQAHVIVGGKLMIFAVSAPLDEQRACDETFSAMLETLTWRAD